MTTYNGEKYLDEQLKSFIDQHLRPDELIIQDDGSTDDTLSIIDNFAKIATFSVIVKSNPVNLGVTNNLEKALIRCTGDIVFIADQDDVWLPDKISRIVTFFNRNQGRKILIIANDALILNDKFNTIQGSLLDNIAKVRGTKKDFVAGCCTAVRRDFLKLTTPIPQSENWEIGYDEWLHLVGDWLGVRYVEERKMQYYRRHDANISQAIEYSNHLTFIDRIAYYLDRTKRLAGREAKINWMNQQLELATYLVLRLQEERNFQHYSTIIDKNICSILKLRIDLQKITRVRRIFIVFQLYFLGKYRAFSGWKSVISDLL